jgi:hypothetical protein
VYIFCFSSSSQVLSSWTHYISHTWNHSNETRDNNCQYNLTIILFFSLNNPSILGWSYFQFVAK